MKVTMRNWQPAANSKQYKSQTKQTEDIENKKEPEVRNQGQEQEDILSAIPGQKQEEDKSLLSSLLEKKQEQESFLNSLLEQAKESSNFKASVSVPDDSTGQLASELASSETKMNVLQVSSKAMRALANLKMAYALSEGKDKEKIAQMIRRMQKLTRQIQKK